MTTLRPRAISCATNTRDVPPPPSSALQATSISNVVCSCCLQRRSRAGPVAGLEFRGLAGGKPRHPPRQVHWWELEALVHEKLVRGCAGKTQMAREGIEPPDTRIFSPLLYQLSLPGLGGGNIRERTPESREPEQNQNAGDSINKGLEPERRCRVGPPSALYFYPSPLPAPEPFVFGIHGADDQAREPASQRKGTGTSAPSDTTRAGSPTA